MDRPRIIAFYLPQFHPVPENDEWWGRGFTEWRNVVRARPQFAGHYQPRLPAHLGYYDLRLPETRAAQAALASAHGIDAFCYWHYWFHGRRLLEKPFEAVLASSQPDFPFCLAWANETWSRRWLGEDKDVLLAQTYSAEDDRAHIRWLLPALADPRAVRVAGRPVFLVYRPADLPAPRRTTDIWREEATRAGLPEPLLIGVNAHAAQDNRRLGFDANLEFEPDLGVAGTPGAPGLKMIDDRTARERMRVERPWPTYRTVFVSWDNTARRGGHATVITESSPEAFRAALQEAVCEEERKRQSGRMVFVNAWNEWAEGNHLEPDQRYGLRYLEAVERVVRDAAVRAGSTME